MKDLELETKRSQRDLKAIRIAKDEIIRLFDGGHQINACDLRLPSGHRIRIAYIRKGWYKANLDYFKNDHPEFPCHFHWLDISLDEQLLDLIEMCEFERRNYEDA